MAKSPCAVFWDIQNIGIPKGQSAAAIVSLIRSSIINLYNLREIYFYCVCDVTKLPANVGNPLTNQDVDIIQAYDYTKDSADIKILDLMRKFVQTQGTGCAIILLSGDGDYAGTLIDLKKLFNITIFIIRLANSFSPKLELAADYAFKLVKGTLQPLKSVGKPHYLVSFSRFPLSRGLETVKSELNGLSNYHGSIEKSAISHENEIIIGFPSLELAHRAANHFNKSRYYGTFLKAEFIPDPPSEILIKVQNSFSNVPSSTLKQQQPQAQAPVIKLNQEVHPDNQTLTFVKVSQLTNLLTEEELTHHFAKLTIPFDSKYVKFHQSSIWIAFSSNDKAQKALNKLKSSLLLGKPTLASIASPPVDLLSSSVRKELNILSKRSTSPITRPLPSQNSRSTPTSPRGGFKSSMKSLNCGDGQETRINGISNSPDQLLPKDNILFEAHGFREQSTSSYQSGNQSHYISLEGYSDSTFMAKWFLTYKVLFEIRDYNPKKIFIQDEIVWLLFTDKDGHSKALNVLDSEFVKTWPEIKINANGSPKLNLSELVSLYCDSNPWCFTSDFGLNFLKIDAKEVLTDDIEKEIRKIVNGTQVDHKLDCIFMKMKEGSLWAAFPDLMCCLDAEFFISTHQEIAPHIQLSVPKTAPNEFLQSISCDDLVGDAKNLAEHIEASKKSDDVTLIVNTNGSVDDLTARRDLNIAEPQMLMTFSPNGLKAFSSVPSSVNSSNNLIEQLVDNSTPMELEYSLLCLMGSKNATFPTNWSLFVNVIKKLLYMGLQKVIFTNDIFWCKFDNETNRQNVFSKLEGNQMNLLPLIHCSIQPQLSANLKNQLAIHQPCNPFCITPELRLHYLKCILLDPVPDGSTVYQMANDAKKILASTTCIFVKADENNNIWAAFPSNQTCQMGTGLISRLNEWKVRIELTHIKLAPVELLPSIQAQDLVNETLELTQKWIDHIKLSSSDNLPVTISSSSASSLSGSSTQLSPSILTVSHECLPSGIMGANAPNSPRRRARHRSNKRQTPDATSNGKLNPTKPQFRSIEKVNAKWIQFDNLRHQFICLRGSSNSEFSTSWSLMYHIIDKTMDSRVYKVILEGSDFWLYFENLNQSKLLKKKIDGDENFLKPLKLQKSISPSKKLVTMIANYHPDIPWCFNHNLGLNFLKSTCQDPKEEVNSTATARSLVEIVKMISSSFKCIFVKFFEGAIWAGFPSIRTCENAKKTLNLLIVKPVFMQSVHPRLLPANLLESIGTSDLVGDALTLSQRWFEIRNATPNSTNSSDRSDLAPQISFITTSTSIDNVTQSDSVISSHVNTDRCSNDKPCSSDLEGIVLPTTTYTANKFVSAASVPVNDVIGVYLTIGDVFQVPMGRSRKKKFVQALVDFVDIPPRSACQDNNEVHLHYNTVDEAERAAKIVETKLFENTIQLKASISNDEPVGWSMKQKYFFGLPRTLPVPSRKLITYIIISPIAKKDSRSFYNSLLAVLQPFYVYFIRHYEESLWIGIGTLEQAEAAVVIIKELKVIGDELIVTIDKKLPKQFWKTIKGETKPTSESTDIPASKASSINGTSNQTESAGYKDSTSDLPSMVSADVPSQLKEQNKIQQSTDKNGLYFSASVLSDGGPSNLIDLSSPGSSKYTKSTSIIHPYAPISPSSSKSESGSRYGNLDEYSIRPLSSVMNSETKSISTNYSPSTTSRTNSNNNISTNSLSNGSLPKEISTILTNPLTSYLIITSYPQTVMTTETVAYLRKKLVRYGCKFVTKLPDYICSGFQSTDEQFRAQMGINGSTFTDLLGHNYTFLTRIVFKPPLNLLSVLKTSDLTLSSAHPSLNPVRSSTLSHTLSNAYANPYAYPTKPSTPSTLYPSSSHPSSTDRVANQQTRGQPKANGTTPNGNLEDSGKSQKKNKTGCYLS